MNVNAEEMRSEFEPVPTVQWQEPEPLPSRLPPVEPVTHDMLPNALRAFVLDVAHRLQCPPDYPAVAALGVLSGVIGRSVCIQPKRNDDWTVVPNLWGMIVGRPSQKKSPAVLAAMWPVRELEAEAEAQISEERKLAKQDALIAQAKASASKTRLRSLFRALDEGGKQEPDEAIARALAAEMLADSDSVPKLRRFTTTDATVEKLAELLADNPRGILLQRDELSAWLRSFDKQNREADRPFFLECWTGKNSMRVDRIERGSTHVEACCVSILGTIQPGPLEELVRGSVGAGDDGFLQRFQLIAFPDAPPDFELVDKFPDFAASSVYGAVVKRLALHGGQDAGKKLGAPLRFSDPAQERALLWLEAHEIYTRSGKEHRAIEAHLAKLDKLFFSLCAILHLCDSEAGLIELATVERAENWARYFMSHARRMYAPITNPELDAAYLLSVHIKAGDIAEPFTVRDVYRNEWSGLASADRAQAAVDKLEALRWLRRETMTAQYGRPSVRYQINPQLRRGSGGIAN